MSAKITLLDYGMCNMLNVARALEHAGADVLVAGTATFRGGQSAYADNIRQLRGG